MRTIAVPARFGPAELSTWFRSGSEASEESELRVALTGSVRLEAVGIVLLAAGVAHRRVRGQRTWMSVDPASERAFALLGSVDFFRELAVEPEGGARVTPGDAQVPLRRISSLETARRQADATRELLERLVPAIPASTVRAAQFVFEELAANIVQHSRASETGFGLAIADPTRKRIQIAFGDAGIGSQASLATNPEFTGRIADDAEAIRLAVDKRVTRGGSGNIGMGFFVLTNFADRVKGDLWIATGDAMLVRRTEEGGERRVESMESTAGWQGACLCLDAPVPGW